MKTILVIDDSALSRELVRDALEPTYEVLDARDGLEGLALMKRAKPDLVLMDIQMPVLDGYSTLQLARKDAAVGGVCIIAMTAYAMEGDRERAIAAGFNGYVAKPVSINALRALVADILC